MIPARRRRLSHPSRAKILAYLAAEVGVTSEHFLQVIRLRREYRSAKMYLRRERTRHLEVNPRAERDAHRYFKRKHAGEGDLHALLREAGMSQQEFCDSIPIDDAVFSRWYGHPMHPWPMRLLEYMIWANNMAAFLRVKGYDPEEHRAKRDLRPTPGNRSPRTKEAGEAMMKKLLRESAKTEGR